MKYCEKCDYWFHTLSGCDCEVADPGTAIINNMKLEDEE